MTKITALHHKADSILWGTIQNKLLLRSYYHCNDFPTIACLSSFSFLSVGYLVRHCFTVLEQETDRVLAFFLNPTFSAKWTGTGVLMPHAKELNSPLQMYNSPPQNINSCHEDKVKHVSSLMLMTQQEDVCKCRVKNQLLIKPKLKD